MKLNIRKVGLGLAVIGLLAVSVTIVAARDFPRPVDLRGGWIEEGLYVQRIPGTYGHLWPIKPLIPTEPGKGNVSAQSAQPSLTPAAPQLSLGAGPLAARVADPVALTGAVSPSAAASVAPPETTGAGATEPANQAVLTAIGIGTIPPVEVSHDGPDAEAGDADTMGSDSADITSFDPKSVRPAATADAVPVTAATIDRTGVVTASPGAAPTVSASVLRSEHVRVLRELAPNREVQRLAVDLDGARVALRFDSDGARVHVVSDPGNQLGGTWASDVQRTLNSGARQQAGFQHRDPDGGRRQRQPYESASAFDERRALDFAARLESAEGV